MADDAANLERPAVMPDLRHQVGVRQRDVARASRAANDQVGRAIDSPDAAAAAERLRRSIPVLHARAALDLQPRQDADGCDQRDGPRVAHPSLGESFDRDRRAVRSHRGFVPLDQVRIVRRERHAPACSTRGRDGRPRLAGRRGREPRTGRRCCQRHFPCRGGPSAPPSRRLSSSVRRQDRCARRRARDAREGRRGIRPRLPPFVPCGAAAVAIHSRTSTSVGFSATIRSKMASASTVRPDRASCSARSRSVDGDWHVMDRTSAVARGMSMPTFCPGCRAPTVALRRGDR